MGHLRRHGVDGEAGLNLKSQVVSRSQKLWGVYPWSGLYIEGVSGEAGTIGRVWNAQVWFLVKIHAETEIPGGGQDQGQVWIAQVWFLVKTHAETEIQAETGTKAVGVRVVLDWVVTGHALSWLGPLARVMTRGFFKFPYYLIPIWTPQG